ncbi:hypothetical protein PSN13_04014 [Micromonospora saelicesensis]|uniref:Uncharacterized protein n=1 Tax=Micromonospora saelicesensis TaxID=285676 RepID=A0A328NQI8_9ACTN|nr:hypothetical protein PSN13_04014 [Micromonospora saelicesensis]
MSAYDVAADSTMSAESAPATVIRSVPSVRVPPVVTTRYWVSWVSPLPGSAPRTVIRPFATVTVLPGWADAVRRTKETFPAWLADSRVTITLRGWLAKYSRW